jgi:hypothetical protein
VSTAGALVTDPNRWRNMQVWCDAYTLHLEALAEAHNDRNMRGALAEATKRTASEAKQSRSQQDAMAAVNQRAIEAQVKRWSPEEHRELMAIWKSVRAEFMATNWDLAQDISYSRDAVNGRQLLVWQGGAASPTAPPPKDALKFGLSYGAVAVRFLKFVAEHSQQFDPLAYTKQMLERQGINAGNFDQHQDRLAIINPWKAI